MPAVTSHSRKQGNKTVRIEPHHRMPRRRPELELTDAEIYRLERKIVELRRQRDEFQAQARSYREVGLIDYARSKDERASQYDVRILEIQEKIRQLKHETVFEGVRD